MAHLSFFVACESLDSDQAPGNLSLIGIFHGFEFDPKEYGVDQFSSDALAAIAWHAVGAWERQAGDAEKEIFHQKMEVVDPNGEITGEAVETIQMEGRTTSFHFDSDGFPPYPTGLYQVRLSTRNSEADPWVLRGTINLEVKYASTDLS